MTQKWIALLRGVNVGGHGRLPMKMLRELLSDAGFHGVQTYIQSGNLIFEADGSAADIAVKITDIIASSFDFSPPCIVQRVDQFDAAIAQNPFPAACENPKTLHLFFLSGPVTFDADGLRGICINDEEFALKDDVFYLYTPHGFGRAKPAEKLDQYLKATSKTARNLNSCLKIAQLARD